MDMIRSVLDFLPPPMRDPVFFAIPFFLVLLTVEWVAARRLEHIESERMPAGSFHTRDAWASISMGLVSILTTAGWKLLALLGYAAIYAYLAPWHLPGNRWYTWVIAIVGVDLLFYGYHRVAHRVRLVWATHQAHHSSEYLQLRHRTTAEMEQQRRDPGLDSAAAARQSRRGWCSRPSR